MALSSITPAVRRFLDSMVVPCVISTLRQDGAPITSATWFGFIGEQIIVATPAERNKARNVRADSRVSFIVDTKEQPYRGVAIEGRAEVLDDHAGELLSAIMERYLGEEGARAARERFTTRRERVILRITAERVRPWAIEE